MRIKKKVYRANGITGLGLDFVDWVKQLGATNITNQILTLRRTNTYTLWVGDNRFVACDLYRYYFDANIWNHPAHAPKKYLYSRYYK